MSFFVFTYLLSIDQEIFLLRPAFLQDYKLYHEERQHYEYHDERRCARPERSFEYEKKRNADERAASEADELSFREVEQHLGFYFG